MSTWIQMAVTIICSVLASGGFWTYLQHRKDKNTAEARMLRGLAHDRIMYLGTRYIERGWITQDEYENLHDYLYLPYRELNGNGTAEKVMMEVKKLPIKRIPDHIQFRDGE